MGRRRTLLTLAALAATAGALIYTTAPKAGEPTDEAPAPQCQGRAFPWGGDGRCWSSDDGDEFAEWLAEHGSSPQRFEENYPELAAVFREPWPPPPEPPYWKTCTNGYACARAVIPQWFTNWSYVLDIVRCETGGTFSQYVVGAAGEVSWYQFHPTHFGWLDEARAVSDPRYATSVAWRMSKGGTDFSPWACA